MTTTVNLTHRGVVVSRWDDGRDGAWKPRPEFRLPLGENKAILWGPSDTDPNGDIWIRYKFPGGAEVTQVRLHALLDEARRLGKTSVILG